MRPTDPGKPSSASRSADRALRCASGDSKGSALAPEAAWPYRRRRPQQEDGMAQAQKRRPASNWAPAEAPRAEPPSFAGRLIEAVNRRRPALRRLGVAASVLIVAVSAI